MLVGRARSSSVGLQTFCCVGLETSHRLTARASLALRASQASLGTAIRSGGGERYLGTVWVPVGAGLRRAEMAKRGLAGAGLPVAEMAKRGLVAVAVALR